jgi:hyperosmotically inducible periplasmic protein
MRKRTVWMVGMLLFGFGACAHNEPTTSSAWNTTKEGFASAYDAVKSGAQETAQVGNLWLQKAGEGAVKVVDRAYTPTRRFAEDSLITTRIKSAYATDPVVKASKVHVDTEGGVVTLRGTVNSPVEAEEAIRKALQTPGVVAVNSQLTFPVERNQARTYVPGEHVRIRE